MSWPLSQDYNEAIQDPLHNFSDAELKKGEAAANALGIPMPRSGNFADVYELRCPSGSRWAVKCFTREVFGLRERYAEIGKYLRLAKLPFMVDFQYLEQGIRVRGQWYPILKMQWVEGFLLNEFVRDNLGKKPILQGLGQIWLKMARRLRESYIAHCDLQHGNVLFVPGSASSLAVKLIDYDGMCVPSLVGTKSGEVGHPAYQHTERLRTGAYDQEVDRFSLLSIAAALRCLAVGGRSLWERYDTGDNLLFRQADFQTPKESPLFQELLAIGDEQARELVTDLHRACQGPLKDVPLLTDLVPEEKPAAPPPSRGKAQPATRTAAPAATQPNAFENIEPTSSGGRARRKAERAKGGSLVPWIAAGGVAACALVGGVLFWAMRSSNSSDNPPAASPRQQARVDKGDPVKRDEEKKAPQLPPVDPPPANPREDKPSKPKDTQPKSQAAVTLLDGPLGELRSFEGHTKGVVSVAFSPDGKRALSAGGDHTVRLWDVASGETIHTLHGHSQMVWSVAFSPDGKRGVSAGFDKTIRVWDLDKSEEIQICKGHAGYVRSAVFTPDGKRVISTSHDRTVRVWDVETGHAARQYQGNKSDAYSMTLSSDGKRVLCGGGDKVVRCWDADSGNELDSYAGSTGVLYTVAISQDGKYVAAAGADKMARIWRASQPGAPLHTLKGHSAQVNAVAFTADGRRLISASADQTIRLWDVATGTELGRFYGPKGCKMLSVAVSPDGRFFLSGGSDRMVRLWRLPPPDVLAAKPDAPVGEVQTFSGHTALVRKVASSFDGRHILSAGFDNTVRLWETATGHELLVFREHKHPQVQAVVFLPDGRRAISGGDDSILRLWDLRDGHEISTFEGSQEAIWSVAVSPDGRYVASGNRRPAVLLCDVATGKVVQQLDGQERSVECISFSPDGRWLVDGCDGGAIHLWDLASGKQIRQFRGHTSDVQSFHFSPDARWALSASRDKSLRLWDVATGQELRRFEGHTGIVERAALSPDGRRAVSGSRDKTVRLWDVATGKELHRFEGHTDKIWDVAFSPDGRYVVSASEDKTLRLWRVPFVPFEVGRSLDIKAEEPKVVGKPDEPDKPLPAPVAAKLPVPDEAALKKATEEVRDIYKADYSRRKADERVVLAGKLLKRGTTKQEEPARRFAYFTEARDLAAHGGDAALSVSAIDEMAKVFAVEPLPMKTEALEAVFKALRTPDDGKKLLRQALTVLDEAESADDYERAAKLVKIAQSAAFKSGDRFLRDVVTQRQSRQKRLQGKYTKIAEAVKTLAGKADDAEANLTVGKFECFDKEDWKKGLTMLAQGSSSILAELARADKANPEKAEAQAELGDKWWAFAEKQSDAVAKSAARHRAQHWYRQALPSLSGDDKVRVESRLELKIKNVKLRPGLVTELFEGESFEKRIKTRMDYKLDHNWGFGSPDEKIPGDHFSITWHGWLVPPRPGKYKFFLVADDGAGFRLDGQVVIDAWGGGAKSATKEIELTAKPYLLKLDFREWTATASISLHWSLDGVFSEQPIPLEALYHDSKQERLLAP